jgi:dTMP kinase
MTIKFVSLEGGEGAGKSTQMSNIRDWFQGRGQTVVETREPGGTPLAEIIRNIVLHGDHPEMSAYTELLMIFAARAQHVEELIKPVIEQGSVVLCDRFTDASYAYQGGGRGLPASDIETLENMVMGELRPDLTILFDLPVEIGLSRASGRGSEDRFETEAISFLKRARQTYLTRAKQHPDRFVVIDATHPENEVWQTIKNTLEDRF